MSCPDIRDAEDKDADYFYSLFRHWFDTNLNLPEQTVKELQRLGANRLEILEDILKDYRKLLEEQE